MTKLAAQKEKLAGKTKELIAEIIGDGKLQEEARAQQRTSEEKTNEPSVLNPFGNLKNLT